MNAESPNLLWGLLFMLIPLFLFFKKQKTFPVKFPFLGLIASLVRRKRSSLKAKKIFSLILRMLVIFFLVAAASKPSLKLRNFDGERYVSSMAVAVVLDNSMSMRLKNKVGVSIFDMAKKIAIGEAGKLVSGDAAGLILTNSKKSDTQKLIYDPDLLISEIKMAQATYGSGDIGSATGKAYAMLNKSPLALKEIWIISDMSDDGWRKYKVANAEKKIKLRLINTGLDVLRDNVVVSQVKVMSSGMKRDAVIETTITNYSKVTAKDIDVILEIEKNQISKGKISVLPGSSKTKKFHHRFSSDNVYKGVVRISHDSLEADDARYFYKIIFPQISVLIIDGDYKPGSYKDEAYYLNAALMTPIPQKQLPKVTLIDSKIGVAGPLSQYDIIFLAGLNTIDGQLSKRILQFMENGGGVFISPGADFENFNNMKTILPLIRFKKVFSFEKHYKIGEIFRKHPVFEHMVDEFTGLEKTNVKTYLKADMKPGPNWKTIISLQNGDPLLLERTNLKGLLWVLLTTMDRGWTDLPIRPGFMPLIHRFAQYSVGKFEKKEATSVLVNEKVKLEVAKGMNYIQVRNPAGENTFFYNRDLMDKNFIDYVHTDIPGHYQVFAYMPSFGGKKEMIQLGFVVNTDPAESNLKSQNTKTENMVIKFKNSGKAFFPLWHLFFMLALITMFAETLMVAIGIRRSA